MKKINIFLTSIIIIVSIITVLFNSSDNVAVVLKDLSVILTITAPLIFEKAFKTKLTEGFKLIWIIFVFMAHYLGVILGVYDIFLGFDKITHTISGLLTAYVAMMVLSKVKIKSINFSILFIVSFSALCAVSWEIFEFVCNILVGGDAQKVLETGVDDTMLDMIVALVGSLIFSLWYTVYKRAS